MCGPTSSQDVAEAGSTTDYIVASQFADDTTVYASSSTSSALRGFTLAAIKYSAVSPPELNSTPPRLALYHVVVQLLPRLGLETRQDMNIMLLVANKPLRREEVEPAVGETPHEGTGRAR